MENLTAAQLARQLHLVRLRVHVSPHECNAANKFRVQDRMAKNSY